MFYGSMIPDSVMSLRTLKPVAKLLLGRLYKYAGERDRCNPSLPTLAGELGASVDTIGRSLKELEGRGFIRPVRHARKEAERVLLWNPLPSKSLRTAATGDAEDDSARTRNHAHDETAGMRNHGGDDSAKMASMIPQNSGCYKEKRIIEENHHQSGKFDREQESARPKTDDDDSSATLKVKTLLSKFFVSEGFRTPRGENPAATIAASLVRDGCSVAEGTAEFLRSYAANLREPPATWKHVLASFETWAIARKRGNLVEFRKGPNSQSHPAPQPSRYPLVSLPDPFEQGAYAS
jgi:hypothetical protein